MGVITLIIIAIGLSVDSFAVSIPCGLISRKINFINASKLALVLAFVQGIMPLLGWLIGSRIESYVETIDHWIAFMLFVFLGGKIILEGSRDKSKTPDENCLTFLFIVSISLATSIDAFIVGVSFALLQVNILLASFIISLATYIFSMMGILIGKKTGSKFEKKLVITGGLLLIAIGIKIFLEHLFFS